MKPTLLRRASLTIGLIAGTCSSWAGFQFGNPSGWDGWGGPSQPIVGVTHTVSVQATYTWPDSNDSQYAGFGIELSQWTSGSWVSFGGAGGSSGTATAIEYRTHTTAGEVDYRAKAYHAGYGADVAYSYHSVTVISNLPPTPTLSVPASVATSGQYTATFSATDAENFLAAVYLESTPDPNNPGATTIVQSWTPAPSYHYYTAALPYYGTAPATAGTLYFRCRAVDELNASASTTWSRVDFVSTPPPGPVMDSLSWGTVTGDTDPGTPIATAGIGSLTGNLTVDNRGAANYSISLRVPPGRTGLKPDLSLNYNSGGGSGPLGLGFSLSTGLPQSITRGRSIFARDGEVRGVTFTSADKLYLDGKRLVCVSGTYGQPGSQYRTEVDSFVTVTTAGTGSNIETFTVTDKSGTSFVFGKYGADLDGYQKAAGPDETLAYAYALKHVQDPLGNAVDFTYRDVTSNQGYRYGEYVLNSIVYNGSPAAGKISFYYNLAMIGGSAERYDRNVSYLAGRAFLHSRRLDSIKVEFGTTQVAYYRLEYDSLPDSGTTRLIQIDPYFRDPAGSSYTSLPPTTFTWPAANADKPSYSVISNTNASVGSGNVASPTGGGGNASSAEFFAFADVDGDGRDDFIDTRQSNTIKVSLAKSDGTGFDAPQDWIPPGSGWWHGPQLVFKMGDINGDGRKDIIYGNPLAQGSGQLYALVSTGTGFVPLGGGMAEKSIYTFTTEFRDPNPPPGSGQLNFQQAELQAVTSRIALGDFNGDGRDDILIHRYDGKLKLLRAEGTDFTALADVDVGASALQGAPTWEAVSLVFLGLHVSQDFSISMMPCDLNGDGLTDYAWVEAKQAYTNDGAPHYTGTKYVYAVTSLPGGGFSPKTQVGGYGWVASSPVAHRQNSFMVAPGDINGDGLTDFMIIIPGEEFTQATDDQGTNVAGGSQYALSVMSYLSVGSNVAPVFKKIDDLSLTGDPHVSVGGQSIRPWFDKVSPGRWFGGYGFSDITAPSLLLASGLSSSADNVVLTDLNGDGRQDYVWYNDKGISPGWVVMYSRGGSFSAPVAAPVNWTPTPSYAQGASDFTLQSRIGLDLNGDGFPDYAFDVHTHTDSPGVSGFYLSQGQPGQRLLAVTDGLGRRTEVSYLPITSDAIYTKGAEVGYPIRELRNGSYVVADVSQDSGSTVPTDRAHFTYQYSGNRLDLSGRGSLGFHSFITLDCQTGLFKYQFLAQSFPMTGLTHREQTYRWWTGGGRDYFRLLSSHDNTVVFDKVATAGGATLWPFISQAVESRWEDSTTAHSDFAAAAASAHPEELFPLAKPAGAHITITASSRFDGQTASQLTLPGVAGYNPSDTNGAGQNVVTGAAAADPTVGGSTFSALPGAITYGNLTKLSTDYGSGFTEVADTTYKPAQTLDGVVTLTGLVETATMTVSSPGYGTETAPVKRYTYEPATSLVKTEKVDTASNLDLTTTYTHGTRGRVTDTSISSPDPAIGTYSVSSASDGDFDDHWDLPTLKRNAAPYFHPTTIAYHAFLGLPTSVTDVNGAQITTAYDALGRTTNVMDVLRNLVTTTTYAADTSVSLAPPGGFNGFAGSTPNPAYPIVAVSVQSAYRVTTESTAKPKVITYFDRLGRPLRTAKESFTGAMVYTDTTYNNLGQVVAMSLPYPAGGSPLWTKTTYDALGRASRIAAPNGTVTDTIYTGRITSVTVTPVVGSTQTNTTLVDAKGRTVKVWNADNPAGGVSGVDGLGGNPASVAFALDGFGRMRATTLKGGVGITASYDVLGRQITLSDPDKGNWTYVNNVLGQVVGQTDASGTVTTSAFDTLGRPLNRTTAGNGSTETADFYYYDSDATKPHTVARGAMGWIGAPERDTVVTTGADEVTNVHYYDALGRPQLDVSKVDGKWFYTHTGYDAYSRPRTLHHYWKPAGAEAPGTQPHLWQDFSYTYSYDTRSYLVAVTDSLGRSWWDSPNYDYLDRVTSVRKGSGYVTTRTYEATDGTLTAINTGGGAIQNLGFGYDGLGNLVSRTDASVSGGESLTYDNLNRLTSSRQGTITYTADNNGNILNKPDVTGTRSTADFGYGPTVGSGGNVRTLPHAIASAFGYTFGYDLNGNLLTRAKTGDQSGATWTGFDKPRTLWRVTTTATNGSEFRYNAGRSRVMQLEFDSVNGTFPNQTPLHYNRKRTYALGSTLELNYNNTTPSGTGTNWLLDTVRIYVPGPDGIIGAREFRPAAGGTEKALVYHYDHLGSITAITDFGAASGYSVASGNKSGRYSEDAWGQRRNPLTWSGAVPSTTDDGGADSLTPRGFTGHEMLDDLGLVHMNGRIYDPLLGRFLSADIMVEFPGSLQSYNRYSYVRNNPLTAFDSSGFAENTYATMTDAATDMVSRGNNVGAFFTVLGQQAFQMVSLGTFSKNSAIAGQVGTNQMSVTEGGVRMGANTAIAATALTAAVVTGGASAAAIEGGALLTGTVGGAVGGFSAAAVQTGGDTAMAAATGGPVPTMGQNAQQIAAGTAVGAAGGALIGGAAALENRVAGAAPQTGPAPEVSPAPPTKSSGQLGREGEAQATQITGAPKNTESFQVNGRTRIPDQVQAQDIATRQPTHVTEVKNVQKQSLTQQLRDDVSLVGPNGRVDVMLPKNATVTKPLQRAFDDPRNPLNRKDLN